MILKYFKRILQKNIYSFLDRYHESKMNFMIGPMVKGSNPKFYYPVFIGSPEKIRIGNNVVINAFVHMWGSGEIEIGDNVMIASHCAITSVTHDTGSEIFSEKNIKGKVVIGSNVWIGAHSVIVPGVKIGDNVIIGANSFVNCDLEGDAVYAGTPVRKVRGLDKLN